jgi:hypothetical protein
MPIYASSTSRNVASNSHWHLEQPEEMHYDGVDRLLGESVSPGQLTKPHFWTLFT